MPKKKPARQLSDPFAVFGPYTPERGDLVEYLRSHSGGQADNLFAGVEYFHKLRKLGFLVPDFTMFRINRSPIPDEAYILNGDYKLASEGSTKSNMSVVAAPAGVYEPEAVLAQATWTVLGLDLNKTSE